MAKKLSEMNQNEIEQGAGEAEFDAQHETHGAEVFDAPADAPAFDAADAVSSVVTPAEKDTPAPPVSITALTGVEMLEALQASGFLPHTNGLMTITLAKPVEDGYELLTLEVNQFAGMSERAIKKLEGSTDPDKDKKAILAKLKASTPNMTTEELVALFNSLS